MTKFRSLTALILIPLVFCLTGCISQTTLAGLVSVLGSTAVTIATIEGNTSLATQLQKDVETADQAVLNWKSGTPTTEVVEALNIVEDDLNLFPLSSVDIAYIDLGIVTVDGILALLPQSTSTTASSNVAHRHFKLVNAKSGKAVKAPLSSYEFNNLKAEIAAKKVLVVQQ
jgi:hypothetical protein